jgi:hypothetical protein
MYNANELLDVLGQRPFRPIRLELSSGERIDITHPDGVIVTEHDALVIVRRRDDGRASLEYVGLDHVRRFAEVGDQNNHH